MHMHWFTARTARVSPRAKQRDLVLMYRFLAMHLRVTCGTERNQALRGIVSALASALFTVDLKVQPRAASLAFPSVPLQGLLTDLLIRFRIQRQTRTF